MTQCPLVYEVNLRQRCDPQARLGEIPARSGWRGTRIPAGMPEDGTRMEDLMSDAGQPPGAARQPLSRGVIVEEAIAVIDEQGLTALTMRSLGARLGVEAMALYRYVNGREDLLEGVVDDLVDRIPLQPDDVTGALDGWQAVLQRPPPPRWTIPVEHPHEFPLLGP